jgi:crotonobetainyl-CoA:carnitine CoA-transferase CaiB-like acyl-CoA transferase
VEPHYWRALCGSLGLHDLLGPGADEWSWADRHERGDRIAEALRAVCRKLPAEDLVRRLSAAGVPVAPVRTLEEVFGEPGAAGRGLASQGWLPPPLPFDGRAVAPAPELGEANEELLGV